MKEALLEKLSNTITELTEIKEELESAPSVTNDTPGEYGDEKDWIGRAEAMVLTGKTSSAFSNFYRRNNVQVKGSGADMKFYKPDLLNRRKQRPKSKAAA